MIHARDDDDDGDDEVVYKGFITRDCACSLIAGDSLVMYTTDMHMQP